MKTYHLFIQFIILVLLACLSTCTTTQHQQKITNQTIKTLAPSGWRIHDSVLRFEPKNLYEHINGRAEFFLAYNVASLAFASFKQTGEDRYINLSIYDMATPTNAFGVFSAERSEGEPPVDLGRDAYRAGANYYIWQGKYYIQLIALGEADELRDSTQAMAQELATTLPDSGAPVWGLKALPQNDRIPHTERFFLVDAMGLDFMTDTYTAKYQKAGQPIQAFLSKRPTPTDAETIITQYTQYADRYGTQVEQISIKTIPLTICHMGGRFDVITQKANLVTGVFNVDSRDLAIQAAVELWQHF